MSQYEIIMISLTSIPLLVALIKFIIKIMDNRY